MADTVLPPPTPPWYVRLFRALLKAAAEGIGAPAAKIALQAQVPWMPAPIISWVVDKFIGVAEEEIKIAGDNALHRVGGDIEEQKYEHDVKPIQEGKDVSDEELQKIKDEADHIIHHG